MIKRLLLASAATASAAILFAAPAAAQSACVLTAGAGGATGPASFSCGNGASASGFYSLSVGNYSSATGDYSTTIGQGAGADGDNSVSIGVLTEAMGFGATAVGSYADATADYAVAIGIGAQGNGIESVAIGAGANNGGFADSVALGSGTTNTAANQVAVGGRVVTQVAAGTIGAASTDAINGSQINTIVTTQDTRDDAQDVLIAAAASGSPYFDVNSVGAPAVAAGTDAIAIGQGATASGTNSIAIGNGANNGGFANSVALGGFTNTAANQVRVGGSTVGTARVVTGVAAGTTTYDAVNFGQLTTTNSRVTALEAMATDFSNDLATLDNRVDKVYKRGRAGTAVAIAMSGNGFLPDKKINVTGNVGFYSGAYAAAIQVGAILTDTVAFNAGVAKGLNDGGKMGARAGFTLGW